MIIDCHGHYTTVPAACVFRALPISNMGRAKKSAVSISDDEIRASLENSQIRLLNGRGIDVMLFSPMASAMGHHFGGELISRHWTEVSNDLIHQFAHCIPIGSSACARCRNRRVSNQRPASRRSNAA